MKELRGVLVFDHWDEANKATLAKVEEDRSGLTFIPTTSPRPGQGGIIFWLRGNLRDMPDISPKT